MTRYQRDCSKQKHGVKYVKKDTSDNDHCYKRGSEYNPFSSLEEAEKDGRWQKLVVLASNPCYGPLDGGIKLKDGQKLVGYGADPQATGYLAKAWITNTTDRLNGTVIVTKGDNKVKNLLISDAEDAPIKGDVVIDADLSKDLYLCNVTVTGQGGFEGNVVRIKDNKESGCIALYNVVLDRNGDTSLLLSTLGCAYRQLCLRDVKINNIRFGISLKPKGHSNLVLDFDGLAVETRAAPAIEIIPEEDAVVSRLKITKSEVSGFSIALQAVLFTGKGENKSQVLITDSVFYNTVNIQTDAKGKVDSCIHNNRIYTLRFSPKDTYLKAKLVNNVLRSNGRSGPLVIEGTGKSFYKLYGNNLTVASQVALEIKASEDLELKIKAENNCIKSERDAALLVTKPLAPGSVLDFGGGKLCSKGYNSLLTVEDEYDARIGSNGFVAQHNWWGANGPTVDITEEGVTVDVSKPLSKPPKQFCGC